MKTTIFESSIVGLMFILLVSGCELPSSPEVKNELRKNAKRSSQALPEPPKATKGQNEQKPPIKKIPEEPKNARLEALEAALSASRLRDLKEQERIAQEQENIEKAIQGSLEAALRASMARDYEEQNRIAAEEDFIERIKYRALLAALKASELRNALEQDRIAKEQEAPKGDAKTVSTALVLAKPQVMPTEEAPEGALSQIASSIKMSFTGFGTFLVSQVVGQSISHSLLNFADDAVATKALTDFFRDDLQPSLEELQIREQFTNYILKPILFPRSSIISLTSLAGSELIQEQGRFASGVPGKVVLAYQKRQLRLERSDNMLARWNAQEQTLAHENIADGLGFIKDMSHGFMNMESLTNVGKKWEALKRSFANKVTSDMSDSDARAEADRWYNAFKDTVMQVLIRQADQGDGLSIFLQVSYLILGPDSATNPLVSNLLMPTIKRVNREINQQYAKSQVVDASLSLVKNIVSAPIAAYVANRHPEVIEFFNSHFSGLVSELPSLDHAKEDLNYLRNFFMWKSVQASIFQYVASIMYLTDAIKIEHVGPDGQKTVDISFDRIIRAHLSKKLRAVPLAIDHALDSLFLLTGDSREAAEKVFFSSLAAIELAKKVSHLSVKYPPIEPVLGAFLNSAYSLKEAGQNWWSLPPGEMGILFQYALSEARQASGMASAEKVEHAFIARAAHSSQLTQVQGRNVAKATCVSAGKLLFSATFASPFAGFLVGLTEVSKLSAAYVGSGFTGGKIFSLVADLANVDQVVSDGTLKALTFINVLIETLANGCEQVPREFKAQFLPIR